MTKNGEPMQGFEAVEDIEDPTQEHVEACNILERLIKGSGELEDLASEAFAPRRHSRILVLDVLRSIRREVENSMM